MDKKRNKEKKNQIISQRRIELKRQKEGTKGEERKGD